MQVTKILNPNNTLSVNRPFAHKFGLNAAVVYAALVAKQAYYEEQEMLDNEGFFYSTIGDMEESTALSRVQQQRALKVLEDAGLIEFRVKGTPAKRFFRVIDDEILLEDLLDCETCEKSADNFAENSQTCLQETDNQVCGKMTNQFAENLQTSLQETDNQDCGKDTYKIAENQQTCLQETDNQDCGKVTNQFAENQQTSLSKTANPIYKTKENKTKNNQSKEINQSTALARNSEELTEGMNEREKYFSLIHDNIEYNSFSEKEKVDEVVGVMLDVLCSAKKTVRVNGEELPSEQVKKRFLELNRTHIGQVLTSVENSANAVRNIRAYLITLLYNAPATVGSFRQKSIPTNVPPSASPSVSTSISPSIPPNFPPPDSFKMQTSSIDMDEVMARIKARYKSG